MRSHVKRCTSLSEHTASLFRSGRQGGYLASFPPHRTLRINCRTRVALLCTPLYHEFIRDKLFSRMSPWYSTRDKRLGGYSWSHLRKHPCPPKGNDIGAMWDLRIRISLALI